jgi:DMSO/TMAO reductase YedYZ molybdopterin-dependent catalytic subunit
MESSHEALRCLGREEMTADFHCVAGWSVQGLRWSGVPLRLLYESMTLGTTADRVSHVRFVGADGFRSVLRLDDALEPDVMLADHLDGRPLGEEHGGPVRLVCPSRYGYKSAKHLTRIELHDTEPSEGHENPALDIALKLIKPHPTARVANEERHRHLPPGAVRGAYFRVLHPVVRYLCGLGERERS